MNGNEGMAVCLLEERTLMEQNRNQTVIGKRLYTRGENNHSLIDNAKGRWKIEPG